MKGTVFIRYLRTRSKWWLAGPVITGTLAILIVLAISVDSRITAWSQHMAQNAADASARAGAASLQELLENAAFACGESSDALVLEQTQLYAALNQVPDTLSGLNMQAYYVTRDADGQYRDLRDPASGQRWQVGATDYVPCEPIRGLHVEVFYPQETLLTRVFSIEHARVRVDAVAVWEGETDWCRNYAIYGLSTEPEPPPVHVEGANLTITDGGVHSNGGLLLRGDEQPLQLDPAFPIEYRGEDGAGLVMEHVTTPEGGRLEAVQAEQAAPPGATVYRLADFQPGSVFWHAATLESAAHTQPGGLDATTITANGDGLYVTDGDVDLAGLPPRTDGNPWHLTIVAEGRITLPASVATAIAPYTGGVLFFSSANRDDAVTVAAEAVRLAGLILAPDGTIDVQLSNGASLRGTLVAQNVALRGTDATLHHDPAFCPPASTPLTLVELSPEGLQSARISAGDGV
ncbi:MAG: hypothetical protein Kow0077_17450 [Anaerolineae bacterium]